MMDERRSDSSRLERDQVLRTDRWSRYQWSRYVDGSERASVLLERGERKLTAFPRFTREVFGRLHGDDLVPVDAVKPEDQWALRAHRELDQLPDFDRLRRRCRGDRVLAGDAACAFAEAVLDRLPAPSKGMEDPEPLREQVRGLLEFARKAREAGEDPAPFEGQMAELRRRGTSAVATATAYAEGLDPTDLRRALRSACEAGHRAAENLEQQLGAFCEWGARAHDSALTVDPEAKAELARHVARSPKLQALAREAGRLRRIAAAKQRSKSDHAREEVVDVALGSDVERVLPSELVKLVDPVLSLDFARRFFERGLLQYTLGGKEALGRGPIVVLLDQSTSMEGAKEVWSKAMALALLQIATSQKRWCRLVGFNTRAVDVTDWDPRDVDPLQLIRAMEPFLGGCTAFEPPLREALEAIKLEPHLKRADVVLITDGEAELSDAFVAEWTAAKVRHEFSCYAIHIDRPGGAAAAQLLAVADKVVGLADIANDEAAATDALFAI